MVVALCTSTPTSMTVVETRTSISPAAKARMVRSLSSGVQPAVQLGDPQPGQRPGDELGVDVLDRGQRHRLGGISTPSSSTSTWSVSPSSWVSPLIRGHTT